MNVAPDGSLLDATVTSDVLSSDNLMDNDVIDDLGFSSEREVAHDVLLFLRKSPLWEKLLVFLLMTPIIMEGTQHVNVVCPYMGVVVRGRVRRDTE